MGPHGNAALKPAARSVERRGYSVPRPLREVLPVRHAVLRGVQEASHPDQDRARFLRTIERGRASPPLPVFYPSTDERGSGAPIAANDSPSATAGSSQERSARKTKQRPRFTDGA